MPTLTAPVLPNPAPSPEIDFPSVSFVGRSLAEYIQSFALDLTTLRARDVLDVAAGPSSFTAEACARKINAVAVDPLYGDRLDELAANARLGHRQLFAEIRGQPRMFRARTFPSIDAADAERRAATQRFVADYETHFIHNRYVAASLPRLPFFDGTFDVVLCGNLLFTDPRRFDLEWHLAACRELVRVSAVEVRLHPLCGPTGRPYPGLARLRRELRDHSIASEVRTVDYEFTAGTHSMLVLRRAPA
jgi:hypothetical protein